MSQVNNQQKLILAYHADVAEVVSGSISPIPVVCFQGYNRLEETCLLSANDNIAFFNEANW